MYNIVARQPYTLQSIPPDISSTHLTPYRVTTKLCFLIFLFELFYNCSLETLSVGICVCVCASLLANTTRYSGSSYMFAAPALELVIFARSPSSFYWRIWVMGMGTPTGVLHCFKDLSAEFGNICMYSNPI